MNLNRLQRYLPKTCIAFGPFSEYCLLGSGKRIPQRHIYADFCILRADGPDSDDKAAPQNYVGIGDSFPD